MADTKISAMPAATALTGTEIVPLLQSGANVQTPVSALHTYLLNKFGTYGNLYVSNASYAQAFNASPQKMTCWASAGPSSNMTISTVNNQITVLNTGIYEVTVGLNFKASNNTNYNFRVYNGTQSLSYANTLLNTHIIGTDIQNYNIRGLISANANDVIYVHCYTDGAADTLTMVNGNFILFQIG